MSEPAAQVCRINIGPRQRAMRMRFGVVSLVAGVALATALVAFGASRAWRLALFAPFLLAGFGVFQAREKT